MGLSLGHILLLLLVVLIFFGAGKLPNVMGDLGKGLRNFKDGFKDEVPDDRKAKQEILPPGDRKGE